VKNDDIVLYMYFSEVSAAHIEMAAVGPSETLLTICPTTLGHNCRLIGRVLFMLHTCHCARSYTFTEKYTFYILMIQKRSKSLLR